MKIKAQSLIETLRQKSIKRNYPCYYPGCNEHAIQSHLLQKRGILNLLTKNNHLYEVDYNPFKPDKLHFKLKGINKAFTFKGFCPLHDDQIFKAIEKENSDLDNYKAQLLLAYRALLNEQRKKETVIDWYSRMIQSNQLDEYVNKVTLNELIQNQSLGIRDNEDLKKKLELELFNEGQEKNFLFFGKYLPYFEICCSAVFSYENNIEISFLTTFSPDESLNSIFVNVIPQKNKLFLSIGLHKDSEDLVKPYLDYFEHLKDEKLLKELSDIIMVYIESWTCSPNFYTNYIKYRESKILSFLKETVFESFRDSETKLNLFKRK